MLSPRAGRILSATGAIIVAGALFTTWYHIDRPQFADPGREVIARYPDLSTWGPGPVAELPRGPDASDRSPLRRRPAAPSSGDVIDSTAREISRSQ